MSKLTACYKTAAALARDTDASREAARHWLSGRQPIPLDRCPAIEAATAGKVRCEDLRADVDWTRDAKGRVTGYHVRVAPLNFPERAHAA
jgi:DNA-binding transcriptional regulator YdaS (Cro superfamily)